MANQLSKSGITNSQTIQAWHVSQSVDALTGTSAYDIKISGSLTLTGSVESLNGFTGNLIGTSSWSDNAVTANTASYVETAQTASYVLQAVSSSYAVTASYALNATSASYANTATSASYSLSSSYAISASQAEYANTASIVENYVDGTRNFSIISPQGTIYTKFDDVNAAPGTDYDLLSATGGTFTGTRALDINFLNGASGYNAKLLKFRVVGKFDTSTGGNFESYVKLGTQTLPGTNLGTISLNQNAGHPFEILYDLVFQNSQVYACGSISYCDNGGELRRVPISNLYTANPTAPAMAGNIQFIVSGSSTTVMTGSLGYIEFMN